MPARTRSHPLSLRATAAEVVIGSGRRMPLSPVRVSLAFAVLAALCLLAADLTVSTLNPWDELGRVLFGFVTPAFFDSQYLLTALMHTVAFGVLGTFFGAVAGLILAMVFRWRIVRAGAAFVRAIHELFWALLFMQVFGLGGVTGVLAIAVPFAGIFAKVYAEILEEADDAPLHTLPAGSPAASAFLFARLPDAWAAMKRYSYYRLECGLRSSAVLGFVGLPTLGFFLESAFAQGYYSQAGAYLILLYGLIASLRLWLPTKLTVPVVIACLFLLPDSQGVSWANVARFFTHDIVPAPLRAGVDMASFAQFGDWLASLWMNQAWPGLINTLIVTQIALVTTGVLTLLVFPLIVRRFVGWAGAGGGHLLLLVLRSTPEYILAYVLLQLWGPSMLPAVIALAVHNAGIIGHLIGRRSNEVALRPNAPRGLTRYGFEILPRVYGPFLAFLFYRWEIIMRETAILGILGIHTLGFYIDSGMQAIRYDVAIALILVTAILNIGVDALARHLRGRLRLRSVPTSEA